MVKFRKPFNAGLVPVTLLLSASALATGLRNLALTAAVREAMPAFPSRQSAAASPLSAEVLFIPNNLDEGWIGRGYCVAKSH